MSLVSSSGGSSAKRVGQLELSELLKCFICYGRVQQARMCPSCSKISCRVCITKWLTERKPQCPHCRSALDINSLVNCRFVEDISSEIDRYEQKRKIEETDVCKTHEAPLQYFCTSCSECICADCAMFDTKHKQHNFERLTAVYTRHVGTIRSSLTEAETRMQQLKTLEEAIEGNINRLKVAKEERMLEIQTVFADMDARLTGHLKAKHFTLLAQKNEVVKESGVLQALVREVTRQLDVAYCAKSALIQRTPELLGTLEEVHRKPVSTFFRDPVDCEFPSELVPEYATGSMDIHHFTEARIREEVIYSDPLFVTGQTWRLKVYPNGNGVARDEYISVFLELSTGFPGSFKYDYRVEMVNFKDPALNVSRVFASHFDVSESWGYNRFSHTKALGAQGFISPDGTVRFNFSVRCPSFKDLARDQQRYIEHLEQVQTEDAKKIDELQLQISSQRSRSNSIAHSPEATASARQSLPQPLSDISLAPSVPSVSSGQADGGAGQRVSMKSEAPESESSKSPQSSEAVMLTGTRSASDPLNLPTAVSAADSSSFSTTSSSSLEETKASTIPAGHSSSLPSPNPPSGPLESPTQRTSAAAVPSFTAFADFAVDQESRPPSARYRFAAATESDAVSANQPSTPPPFPSSSSVLISSSGSPSHRLLTSQQAHSSAVSESKTPARWYGAAPTASGESEQQWIQDIGRTPSQITVQTTTAAASATPSIASSFAVTSAATTRGTAPTSQEEFFPVFEERIAATGPSPPDTPPPLPPTPPRPIPTDSAVAIAYLSPAGGSLDDSISDTSSVSSRARPLNFDERGLRFRFESDFALEAAAEDEGDDDENDNADLDPGAVVTPSSVIDSRSQSYHRAPLNADIRIHNRSNNTLDVASAASANYAPNEGSHQGEIRSSDSLSFLPLVDQSDFDEDIEEQLRSLSPGETHLLPRTPGSNSVPRTLPLSPVASSSAFYWPRWSSDSAVDEHTSSPAPSRITFSGPPPSIQQPESETKLATNPMSSSVTLGKPIVPRPEPRESTPPPPLHSSSLAVAVQRLRNLTVGGSGAPTVAGPLTVPSSSSSSLSLASAHPVSLSVSGCSPPSPCPPIQLLNGPTQTTDFNASSTVREASGASTAYPSVAIPSSPEPSHSSNTRNASLPAVESSSSTSLIGSPGPSSQGKSMAISSSKSASFFSSAYFHSHSSPNSHFVRLDPSSSDKPLSSHLFGTHPRSAAQSSDSTVSVLSSTGIAPPPPITAASRGSSSPSVPSLVSSPTPSSSSTQPVKPSDSPAPSVSHQVPYAPHRIHNISAVRPAPQQAAPSPPTVASPASAPSSATTSSSSSASSSAVTPSSSQRNDMFLSSALQSLPFRRGAAAVVRNSSSSLSLNSPLVAMSPHSRGHVLGDPALSPVSCLSPVHTSTSSPSIGRASSVGAGPIAALPAALTKSESEAEIATSLGNRSDQRK